MLERCAGLIFGFVFHGGRASRVSDDSLAAHLDHELDWIWLHLGLADHRAKRFLESFDLLPVPARQLLLAPREERIQFHLTANGAYGVLPDIERDFADHSLGTGRLAFWFDAGHLVTSRLHSLRGVEHVHQAVAAGAELAAPVMALVRLQEEFVGLVEQRLVVLGSELAGIEDEVLADRDHIGRDVLGPLRRELSRYAREFSALRGAIHRALSARHLVHGGPLLEHLPLLLQEAEDFERDAAALSDRARLLYEEIGSRIADRSNRALSALTVISTLLLPPTFLVGAFGMNVGGIPWAQAPHGFWAGLGLCLTLVLGGWALLRRFRILP
ncbi:MAG: CorA family divalent cation transporter [Alphaproteobacteria bacterium]|jgi:zinc transporter